MMRGLSMGLMAVAGVLLLSGEAAAKTNWKREIEPKARYYERSVRILAGPKSNKASRFVAYTRLSGI